MRWPVSPEELRAPVEVLDAWIEALPHPAAPGWLPEQLGLTLVARPDPGRLGVLGARVPLPPAVVEAMIAQAPVLGDVLPWSGVSLTPEQMHRILDGLHGTTPDAEIRRALIELLRGRLREDAAPAAPASPGPATAAGDHVPDGRLSALALRLLAQPETPASDAARLSLSAAEWRALWASTPRRDVRQFLLEHPALPPDVLGHALAPYAPADPSPAVWRSICPTLPDQVPLVDREAEGAPAWPPPEARTVPVAPPLEILGALVLRDDVSEQELDRLLGPITTAWRVFRPWARWGLPFARLLVRRRHQGRPVPEGVYVLGLTQVLRRASALEERWQALTRLLDGGHSAREHLRDTGVIREMLPALLPGATVAQRALLLAHTDRDTRLAVARALAAPTDRPPVQEPAPVETSVEIPSGPPTPDAAISLGRRRPGF